MSAGNTRLRSLVQVLALSCTASVMQATAQVREVTPVKFEIHRPEVFETKTNVSMGNRASVILKGSDSLEARHPLEFRILDVPQHGVLSEIEATGHFSAKLIYTPNAGFRGRDEFTFTASDGLFTSLSQRATIFVLGPSDDPGKLDTDAAGIAQSKSSKPGRLDYRDSGFAVFNADNWFVSQRIGVGTDNPLDRVEIRDEFFPFLLVNATTQGNAGAYFRNPNQTWYLYTETLGNFRLSRLNGMGPEFFLSGTSGFLGVGTTAPFQQLTMGGTIGWKDGTNALLVLGEGCCASNSRMLLAHSGLAPTWGIFYDDVPDIMRWQQTGAGDAMFSVNMNSRRVGVNTATPAADFHIAAYSSSPDPELRMSANGALSNRFPHVLFYDSNTNTGMAQLVADVQVGSFVFDYRAASGGDFTVRKALNSGDPADVVIFGNSAGNLGIGTTALADGARMTVNGNLHVIGNFTKTGLGELVRIADGDREIEYSVSIGPEIGTYVRGTARLENGEAVVELPEHFTATTSGQGLTVQLTLRDECNGLRIVESNPRRLVVRELARGSSNAQFDYLVQGLRKGHENHRIVHPR